MPTVRHVLDKYLEVRGPQLSPVTARQYPVVIQHCFPDWLDREVADITKHDCIKRYEELCSLSHKLATAGGKGQADHAFRILCALLNFSGALYDVPVRNPVSDFKTIIRPGTLKNREGHIPAERLKDWYGEIQKLNPTDRDINVFWLMTGCRRREVAEMQWDWINWTDRVVTIPGPLTKNKCPHRVYLSGSLLLMLQTRRFYYSESPYVFPAHHHRYQPYSTNARPHQEIESKLGANVTCNPHALRHTFATCARMSGLTESDVSILLNHKKGGVTGGYIHMPFEEIKPKWLQAQRYIAEKLGLSEKRRYQKVG